MRRTLLVLGTILSILVAACGPASSSGAPSAGTSAAPPAASAGASAGASAAAGWDPQAISGTAILSGWKSSADEGEALTQALLGFNPQYPNITIDYQTDRRRLPRQMITKFSSGDVPGPLLRQRRVRARVDRRGLPRAARRLHREPGLRHLDVLPRLPGHLQGRRRHDLRPAEGRQHDRDGLQHGPRDDAADDARRARHGRRQPQGPGDLKAPICLSPGLDRGLAFIVRAGRLAPDRGRHRRRDRHRRVQGRGAVVPRPDQERPGHDAGAARRRLVRRGARQGRHRPMPSKAAG